MIGSVILIIVIILGVLAWSRIVAERSSASIRDGWEDSVTELVYCGSSDIKPCVVSFNLDEDNNMLVNLLLSDLSYPDFYLKITRGGYTISYECQRIAASPNNANCIGENLPPGELLHLMLISTKDEVLLAEGSLSIIGLAFPTLEIVIPTDMPITSPEPSPTDSFDFVLPTQTPIQFPTQASTQPSYP